jgi:hypothetical protein
MALTLQDPNLVWQKVGKLLSVAQVTTGTTGGVAPGPSPVSQNVFKALKLQLATSQLNFPLQFAPFSYAQITGATGYQVGISGAFHVYAIWAKKTGTGTTGAYLGFSDAESGAPTGMRAQFYMVDTTDEVAAVWPGGLDFATDVTVLPTSTATGTTAITGAGDVINGFMILGA